MKIEVKNEYEKSKDSFIIFDDDQSSMNHD